MGVIGGPLRKIFGKKKFQNFSKFSIEIFALACLGKKFTGKLGQKFLTGILKNFFTKKCLYGSSDDAHEISGHYFCKRGKNTYPGSTGGGLLMPFKVAKFMHYIIDIPL